MSRLLPVAFIAERLTQLDPDFYAGWTGETVREWCADHGITVTARGLVAHRDLLAAMDRRTAARARQALAE